MLINKMRVALVAILGVLALGLGAVALARQAAGDRPADGRVHPAATLAKDAPTPNDDHEVSPRPTAANDPPRPTFLRLVGRLWYPEDKLHPIQPRFDCLIERVFVGFGEAVKKGDPLLQVSSADLAAAKNDYQVTYAGWRRALDDEANVPTGPAKTRAQIDGTQKLIQMKSAKDKLVNYGLTEEEIEHLIKPGQSTDNKRMTIRSSVDGLVIAGCRRGEPL